MKSIFTREYTALVERLSSARKASGATQRELAARLGRPQSFVSKYERKERRLDAVELIAVCRALNIEASEVVRAIDERQDDVPGRRRESDR